MSRGQLKRLFLVLYMGLLASSVTIVDIAQAERMDSGATSVSRMVIRPGPMIHAPKSGTPWIRLRDGVELSSHYIGAAGPAEVLKGNLALPLALASADFDEDGAPDLITGCVGPSGGILTLHRGNVDSIYPHHLRFARASTVSSPLSVTRDNGESTKDNGPLTTDPPAFLSPARVFEVPEAPELLGVGDFDADGHWDVVTAARGSEYLWLLAGNGHGGFNRARSVKLSGAVTALTSGEINRRDGLTDLIVGITGPKGPEVLVFESAQGAIKARPEAFALPVEATALALGQLDDSYEMDLAVAAGHELLVIHGRDRRLSIRVGGLSRGRPTQMPEDRAQGSSLMIPERLAGRGGRAQESPPTERQAEIPPAIVEEHSFPFAIASLALGNFIRDEANRTDIALLAEDGTVHVLSRTDRMGDIPAPVSGRHRLVDGARRSESIRLKKWQDEVLDTGPWQSATRLVQAKLSSLPTDDLVLIDPANRQLHIVNTHQRQATQDQGRMTHDTVASIDATAVAILPMRLNGDALDDLVILQGDQDSPSVMMTVAALTFTVNSTANTLDANPGDGVCADAVGNCTLQAAIQEANANAGADMINFNIPGAGAHTITINNNLGISDPVTIDGYTQPGSSMNMLPNGDNAVLQIEVKGASVLVFPTGSGTTIRGLDLNGPLAGTGGMYVRLDQDNNIIEGNFIGTNLAGAAVLGSSVCSCVSVNGGTNNRIGGTAAAARNLIAGAGLCPFTGNITMAGTGTLVQGNLIGTDATGTAALGSGGDGVFVGQSVNATIGGTAAGARNVISGNTVTGVDIDAGSATGNLVQGNFIGVSATGTQPLGNGGNGVWLQAGVNNTVGGTVAAARNIISANRAHGVRVSGTGHVVQGNHIGTQANGTSPLGNILNGVDSDFGNNNSIGGAAAAAGNTIAFNSVGVRLLNTQQGNPILSNSIHDNTGLGIDLSANPSPNGDGVTPNDPNDADVAAGFNTQNFPVLTSATSSGGNTTIQGSLNSRPNMTYMVQFFSSPSCDPSGNGEGQTFLGSANVMTDGTGNVNFNVMLAVAVGSGQQITAAATNPGNSTSEFSACIMVVVSGGCAATAAAQATVDPIGTLDLLYRFRDDVLSRTERGQQYTRWFYQFTGEGVNMMVTNAGGSSLMSRTASMLDRYRPVIQSLVSRGKATVSPAALEDIDGLLGSYMTTASPELRNVIEQLKRDLRDPRVQADFGITVGADGGCASVRIVQDDRNGNCLELDRCMGGYEFKTGNGETFIGPVVITEKSGILNFQSGPGDPNLLQGGVNLLRRVGSGRLQVPRSAVGRVFNISDSNTDDNRPCR